MSKSPPSSPTSGCLSPEDLNADVPISPKTVAWLNVSDHDAIHAVEAGLATASKSSNPARLSHTDESGRARMVDVGGKPDTERLAVAKGEITMRPETLALIHGDAIQTIEANDQL